MLISLRGTNGSGKSTIVSTILERYPKEEISGEKKPDGYKLSVPWLDKPLFIVGAYKTKCGGCDSIQPYALIWPRIAAYAQEGHVLFEGALVSSSYGTIGRASEVFGDEMVFAFLDTPLEKCIKRVESRRLARGNTKPLDPKNVIVKFKNVERSIRVITEIGRRVVIIDHRKAVAQILGLFDAQTSS